MKNVQFTIVLICLSVATVFSQSNSKINISAGVGFEPTTYMDDASVNTLPMNVKVSYQLTPMFSLGAFGGFSSTTSKPTIINDGLAIQTTSKKTFLGLRGELKKGLGEMFEVYGGAAVGYMSNDLAENTTTGRAYLRDPNAPTTVDPNQGKGSLLYTGFVGTNFYPTKHIGLFAELGYGVSLLNGGVTFRF